MARCEPVARACASMSPAHLGLIGWLREVLEVDHLEVDTGARALVGIPDVGHAAGHAGREVAPDRAQDHGAPAGHVLAAVVADALDHDDRARVAHAEALARQAPDEGLAGGCPVEGDIAADDVLVRVEPAPLGGYRMALPPERPLQK